MDDERDFLQDSSKVNINIQNLRNVNKLGLTWWTLDKINKQGGQWTRLINIVDTGQD